MLLNVYATRRELPALGFPHVARARRDRSDPALAPHLDGFASYVLGRGAGTMTSTRYAVLRHLARVRHHLALEVADAELPAFAAWAVEANALVFHPDGSVRDAAGAVLVDPRTGDAAANAEVPYPAEARTRATVTTAALAARGLRVSATLPPVVGDTEVILREPPEVAGRVLALFACALRAESAREGKPIATAELVARFPGVDAALSPRERAFLDAARPEAQAIVNFGWGYEALATLVWALGLGELPFPSGICDVSRLASTLLAHDRDARLATAALRPTAELLDALDLVYRLHWITTEARLGRVAAPADVVPGVVLERHRALNWLTRFDDAAWDDVTTPT